MAIATSLERIDRIVRMTLLACFVLIFGLCGTVAGYSQGTTASLTGTVTDSTGAAIVGATVTITQVETNTVRRAVTPESGIYTVPQLPPGTYNVAVEKTGFSKQVQNGITLVINQVAQINASLQPGSDTQTVTVTSESPIIQTDSSSWVS